MGTAGEVMRIHAALLTDKALYAQSLSPTSTCPAYARACRWASQARSFGSAMKAHAALRTAKATAQPCLFLSLLPAAVRSLQMGTAGAVIRVSCEGTRCSQNCQGHG